jgi:hypothetical protein
LLKTPFFLNGRKTFDSSIKLAFLIIFGAKKRFGIYGLDTVFHAASDRYSSKRFLAPKIMRKASFIEESNVFLPFKKNGVFSNL